MKPGGTVGVASAVVAVTVVEVAVEAGTCSDGALAGAHETNKMVEDKNVTKSNR
jgi:hypothetical protein